MRLQSLKRRDFLLRTAGTIGAAMLPFVPGVRVHAQGESAPPKAPVPQPPSPAPAPSLGVKSTLKREGTVPFAENLAGEELTYVISVLWFIKAAEGRISFQKGKRPGLFEAKADASAIGFVGWITNYRKVGFYSTLKVFNDKGQPRLVTTKFKRTYHIGEEQYRSDHRFNYRKRKWRYKVYKNGKLKKARSKKIKAGVWYDDFIAAMYNFRLGVYGAVKKGADYVITTIPHKKVDRFHVHICSEEEEKSTETQFLRQVKDAAYVFHVPIDQKIFGIKAGLARFAGRKDLLPLFASIQDAVSLGNVKASLANPPSLEEKKG